MSKIHPTNLNLDAERLYRRKHAAEILDCSVNHIDKLSRQGKLVKKVISRRHSGITGHSLIELIEGFVTTVEKDSYG